MIREIGNVELFELCETIPKVQCSECLLYWNQGIVYCTCGHLLRDIKSSRHFHQWRLDVLSIPNCVIKKGRPRGARHGKTEAQKEHVLAHNVRKRCIKKNFKGIHDRFQRDSENVIRNSKLAGPSRSASRWTSWRRKISPTAHPLRSTRDIRKTVISYWTNQAEMHRRNSDQTSEQQSQLWTVSTTNLEKSDLNQSFFINIKGGIRLLLLPVLHGGSGMKTGGAHNSCF